jgi:hypothetical protein
MCFPDAAVPTISEWTLVIMTVLFIGAGTIMFSRRGTVKA